MSEPAVVTQHLTRDFGSCRAVDAIDLQLEKGTLLALLGPNGAGKTTFLRLLLGLIEPTAGQASVLGQPARRLTSAVAGRVASVGDSDAPPGWTKLGDLELLQSAAALAFDKDIFRRLCSRHDLSPAKSFGAFSKGQRRWILTSLALASRPELILLDEPADGLDPAVRKELYDELRSYVNDSQAAAIVTTHIISDIERVCDDVAIIDHGRLVLHAPLEELREQVRQVELDNVPWPEELSERLRPLGRITRGASSLLWVKPDGMGDEELKRRLGKGAVIRHVGLESLYLSIVGASGDLAKESVQ